MTVRIRIALVVLAVSGLVAAPLAADAQPPFMPYDTCFAARHFPPNPIDGAPSIFGFYASLGTRFMGGAFTFDYDGASGPQTGTGDIDNQGIGHGYGPAYAFGLHSLTTGTITDADGMTFDLDLSGLSYDLGEDEPVCDMNDLSVVDDAPKKSTSSTQETTSTSQASTSSTEADSTTSEATTSTVEATTSTVEESPPTSIQIVDDDGNTYIAWWWFGGILLVVGAGLFFFVRADEEDCIPLKAAWLRAKKECEEAKAEVKQRQAVLEEAKEALADAQAERKKWIDLAAEIEAELDQLRSSRGTSMSMGGTTYHRIPEGMVTAEGLESIIEAVEARLQNAKDNVPDVSQTELDWQKRVADQQKRVDDAQKRADELCKAAAAAKKAYEDCIKASAEPEPTDSDTDGGSEGGSEGGSTPGGTPGTAGGGEGGTGGGGGTPPAPPTAPPERDPEPGCTNGEKKNEKVDEDKTFQVPKNISNLIISVEPPTEDFAEWLAEELAKAGGRFAPNKLNDPAFSGTVRSKLRDLDTDLGVSH